MAPPSPTILLLVLALGVALAQADTTRYIVQMRDSVDENWFMNAMQQELSNRNAQQPGPLLKRWGASSRTTQRILASYKIGAGFKAVAADLEPQFAQQLSTHPDVEAVEVDVAMEKYAPVTTRSGLSTTQHTQQNPPSWSLSHLSSRTRDHDNVFRYPSHEGNNAVVFVLDTGIDINHPDLKGRAYWGFTACQDEEGCTDGVDGDGHGTHVAGIVAGNSYGVAKRANVVAVKVLGDDGSGSLSSTIKGIAWTAYQAAAMGKTVIANMSLGGPKSTILDKVVKVATEAGVLFVVAAGNGDAAACQASPARSPLALTVGASTPNNERATFSNHGSCVDVFAPGVGITSIIPGGKTATWSGTSMASPSGAGAAALVLGGNPKLTPEQVKNTLLTSATTDALSKIKRYSPNKLLYIASEA